MGIERTGFALCLLCTATLSWGQTPVDKEWSEGAVPPPPPYVTQSLVPIEMPPYVTLKVGIDPQTLAIGADGIVRYVVVMRNASGSTNAAYEGISCRTGEVKTYARAGTSATWALVRDAQWRDMTDNLPSRHAYAIAKQGVCNGRQPGEHVTDILKQLRQGQPGYQ